MDKACKTALLCLNKYFIENLTNEDVHAIVTQMYENDLFQDEHREKIQLAKTSHETVRLFMEWLPTLGPECIKCLTGALKDNKKGYMVTKLEQELKRLKEMESKGDFTVEKIKRTALVSVELNAVNLSDDTIGKRVKRDHLKRNKVRKDITAVVVSTHERSHKCYKVSIQIDQRQQTEITAISVESRNELKRIRKDATYVFKNLLVQNPGERYRFSVNESYIFDEGSEVSSEKCSPITVYFTPLNELKNRREFETVNIKGFFMRVEKSPKRRINRVKATIWLQSNGWKTCVDIFDENDDIFQAKRGDYFEIRDVSVRMSIEDEKPVVHLMAAKKSAEINQIESFNDKWANEPNLVLRDVVKLESVYELPFMADTNVLYEFRAVIQIFKGGDDAQYCYLACPLCTKLYMLEQEGECIYCPYNTDEHEEKPYESLVMNVDVRDITNYSNKNPVSLVIFASCDFFAKLPAGIFMECLNEEKFLGLEKRIQDARLKKITRKELEFRFVVTLSSRNPVVQLIEYCA